MAPLSPVDLPSLPGVAELRDLFNKANVALNPVLFLIELGSVDCDRLRSAGGSGGWGGDKGHVYTTLNGDGGVVEDIDEWRGRLKEHWGSPAVRGADAKLAEAVSNLRHEADFVPRVGAELEDLADILERSFLDVAGVVLATAGVVAAAPGVVLAVAGLVLTAAGPESGGIGFALAVIAYALSLVSLVLAAASYVAAYYAALKPRIDALTKADSLFEQVANAKNKWS